MTAVLDPHLLPLSDGVRVYARRWEIELASLRALKDHLHLPHMWSVQEAVVHIQWWCCLILAQVYYALQVEIAGQTGVEVCEISLDLLVLLTAPGLAPCKYALRFGRDPGLLRLSTHHHIEVPPCWVVPPSPEAVQPREMVRSRSQTQGTGTKSGRQKDLDDYALHLPKTNIRTREQAQQV